MSDAGFRRLPPVHAVLDRPELAGPILAEGREATLRAVRATLDEARSALARGEGADVDLGAIAGRAARLLASLRPTLRPVLNATGILLNTGLGRAPLARGAIEAVDRVARGYCNLEIDLESGGRGSRTDGVEGLLRDLTGAEAAAVVNNNAAATILAVRALARGGEVIVSRGQLVEIGGSFRLPEIIEASGARLREVGTTNKTRLGDYEAAIGPETAAILRVHPSNYRVVGFTESVPIAELAGLGKARDLWVIDDIGSGRLAPGLPPWVDDEPSAAEGLAAGADVVLFSGDKILGGPQSGILVGSREAIGPIRRDPLMRALRVDKMTLAALEATLRAMLDPARAAGRIPLWSLRAVGPAELMARAARLADRLRSEAGLVTTAVESVAYLGGGSAPGEEVASAAVRVDPPFPAPFGSEGEWARALRLGEPAVVARVRGGAVWLDLRAIAEGDDEALATAVGRLAGGGAIGPS